jgi:hypothetical protein
VSLVMSDGDDLDDVLGAQLVHDRVRKGGHHVVVHGSIGLETLDQRPAMRRLRHGVESRPDRVEEAITNSRISFIVPVRPFAEVGAGFRGDDEIQLSTPTKTAFDLPTRLRPRREIGAALLDLAGSLFELLDPFGVETAVRVAGDAFEQLVSDVCTLCRVELERSLDNLLCGGRHGS